MASNDSNEKSQLNIGIIGMGDMGKLYAKTFLKAGYENIHVCDLPEKYSSLLDEYKDNPKIKVHEDGRFVSRVADFIFYSVEAAQIKKVVSCYGPSTKVGAIVAGQTSVKQPEIEAFEEFLPKDVHIVTCHSFHGPSVNPKGQPMVIIKHRSNEEQYQRAIRVLSCFESKFVPLTYLEHDKISADTQTATHLAFLSMGTAWKAASSFPWENPSYVGGIDNVKVLMALRIYGNKWHVYGGLAIMNPSAKVQVRQYAQSTSDLFKLMIQEKEKEFKERILKSAEFVFGNFKEKEPILLSDQLLDQFSLSAIPKEKRVPNSHLSLLAMVDCWHILKINPYDHLICQTPPFRLLLGITEYCFRNEEILNESIHAALYNKNIRADDMEFYSAVKGWSEIILLGSMEGYQQRFENTASFFHDRLSQAAKKSSEMINLIARKTQQ